VPHAEGFLINALAEGRELTAESRRYRAPPLNVTFGVALSIETHASGGSDTLSLDRDTMAVDRQLTPEFPGPLAVRPMHPRVL